MSEPTEATPWRPRDLLLAALTLVAALAALHAVALEVERSGRQAELIESATALESAMLAYNREHAAFPPSAEPAAEALRLDTLEPLVARGMLWDPRRVTEVLADGRLAAYQSPDRPKPNADFWAVLVHAEDPTVQCLVADTDEFPGHLGERLRGTYLIEGTRLRIAER